MSIFEISVECLNCKEIVIAYSDEEFDSKYVNGKKVREYFCGLCGKVISEQPEDWREER